METVARASPRSGDVMAETQATYSDVRPCAKCGSALARAAYLPDFDVIRKLCERCGAITDEAPLDRAPPGEV